MPVVAPSPYMPRGYFAGYMQLFRPVKLCPTILLCTLLLRHGLELRMLYTQCCLEMSLQYLVSSWHVRVLAFGTLQMQTLQCA